MYKLLLFSKNNSSNNEAEPKVDFDLFLQHKIFDYFDVKTIKNTSSICFFINITIFHKPVLTYGIRNTVVYIWLN